MNMTIANPYTLTALKTFIGMEGQGFNANLLHNGKKVAFVIDEGCGGCLLIQWIAKDRAQQDADEATLKAYAATLPSEQVEMGDGTSFTMESDSETVVNNLVDALLSERDLKRLLSRKVAMLRTDGKIVTLMKVKPTPQIISQAVAKFTEFKVLNALPFGEALELYKAAA